MLCAPYGSLGTILLFRVDLYYFLHSFKLFPEGYEVYRYRYILQNHRDKLVVNLKYWLT